MLSGQVELLSAPEEPGILNFAGQKNWVNYLDHKNITDKPGDL